jgi:excisionase family DNA binding protein
MDPVSVAQAAKLLGVAVQRVRQRIADGSLPAEKVGSQYVIDRADLLPLREQSAAGRPLSERSVISLLLAAEPDADKRWSLLLSTMPAEASKNAALMQQSRARKRLDDLLGECLKPDMSDPEVRQRAAAAYLRKMLANRAERRLYRASPRDLGDLRSDPRLRLAGLSHPDAGIASGDMVEAYADADARADIERDFLLDNASAQDANVILHFAPKALSHVLGQEEQGGSALLALLLAADLAEHRNPRSERAAVGLLEQAVSALQRNAAPGRSR